MDQFIVINMYLNLYYMYTVHVFGQTTVNGCICSNSDVHYPTPPWEDTPLKWLHVHFKYTGIQL